MKKFTLLCCLPALSMAFQPTDGLYFGLYAGTGKGLAVNNTTTIFGTIPGIGPVSTPADFSGGYKIGINLLGYRIKSVRAELEIQRQAESINKIHVNGVRAKSVTGLGTSGRHTQTGAMLNVLYDITYFSDRDQVQTAWIPYVGAGVGLMKFEDEFTLAGNVGGIAFSDIMMKQTATENAGQFIFGFNYFLDSYTYWFMDYRYFSSITRLDRWDKRYRQHGLQFGINFAMS